MTTGITKNTDRPQTKHRISMIGVMRLVAALTMLVFVIVAVKIVFSGPTRSLEGFFIQRVEPGSPADIAGVSGILTHINGKRITSSSKLSEAIYDSLGEPMAWTLNENNTVRIVEVTPLERPEVGQSPTGVISAQILSRPVGRISRIIVITPIAYIGVGMLVLAEFAARRRRRAGTLSKLSISTEPD